LVCLVLLVAAGCKADLPPLDCYDVGGHDCVFPFEWKNKEFYSCTTFDSSNGRAWCATRTRRGVAVEYDDCALNLDEYCYESECTTTSGSRDAFANCVFPFTYDGVTHTGCAKWVWGGQNRGKFWCSTQTDSNGNHVNGRGKFGICNCNACECINPLEGSVPYAAAAPLT